MSESRAELLVRIEAFSLDGDRAVALPFAARLAREHDWSRSFAARVVREYKRFAFLAVTAGRPVCPSEQVDAVQLILDPPAAPAQLHQRSGPASEASRFVKPYTTSRVESLPFN